MLVSKRVAWLLPAGLLLMSLPLAAQVKLGETSSKLSGTVALGYTANYGDVTTSTHGWTVGGDATLSGAYHNPNFLSYNGTFYLNQSRANSNFQSISDASGFNLSASIFSGSKFPGSVSYSRAYNSEGNYAVPGLSNFVTHGNNDTIGVNWSENLPDKPSLSVGVQTGSSQYSVYGSSDTGSNAFHSINLHSGYKLSGFNMGAYYTSGGSHAFIPQVVTGLPETEMHSGTGAFGVNVNHILPLSGSFNVGFNRSDWSSNYLGTSNSGTINMLNSVATMRPARAVAFSFSANYSDNLAGQLFQSVVSAGGVVPGVDINASSDSLDLMGIATYSPADTMQTSVFVERRTQSYEGQDFGVTSYGGSATYAHKLFNGNFNASASATGNRTDTTGEDTLGFSTSENYSGQIGAWHFTGMFSYAQNVQTLLVTYMNSYYNYSANARRSWGKFRVGFGAGAARTGLTNAPSTDSSSQSYNASVGYNGYINATGSYSRSNGQALVTGGGLVPVPIPSPPLPSNLVSLYGGDSYSVGVSSTPVRRLIIAGTWGRSLSNTANNSVFTNNQNSQANVLLQYQFRKLSFNSGYARLQQSFNGSNSQPETISSFYFGVSRWFNFF